MTDEEILSLLLNGDQKALSLILNKYGRILAVLARNTGITNEEDVMECISDILYTVWRRKGKFDENRSSFKTWLIIVARGCIIDHARKHRKFANMISFEDTGVLLSDSSPLDDMIDQEIIDLLQKLPPPDNEIFFRRFILGESVAEISSVLNLSGDNIYKRISRGKGRLRSLLKREGYCNV